MMQGLEYRSKENRERRQSKRILANEFGRSRGWLRSSTPFSLEQLRRRSNKIRAREDTAFNADAVFYRDRNHGHRPAAIAVHFESWPDIGPEIESICERFNLRYEAVADFPNWMDGAQLIVFTPQVKQVSRKPQRRRARCPQLQLPF